MRTINSHEGELYSYHNNPTDYKGILSDNPLITAIKIIFPIVE